ncbi:hypothetical protein AHAS_Ahas07G0058600 [Arachis hypogaea]
MDPDCFIPSLLGVQVDRQFRPHIQAISIASNVAVAAHMKIEAITEPWFREKAEGSDRSGGQCGHGDSKAEEEGDGDDDDGLKKSNLLSRFIGSIKDDKHLERDVVGFVYQQIVKKKKKT